jgi:hypothetical protein
MTTSDQKPEYVLFISQGDKFCSNFLNKLKPKPELIKKFNIVDISKIPAIPDEVEEVPCVYDGKQVFQGSSAFKWLNEKLSEYLSPANDGMAYSFLDGQEEQVFQGYSLLEQKNGSFGMGGEPTEAKDPTRMITQNDNTNKNRSMDSLIASRTADADYIR